MNNYTLAHVSAELIVFGSMTYFFTKKLKNQEEYIKKLESLCGKLVHSVKSNEKHIQNIYSIIEGLNDNMQHKKNSGDNFTYFKPVESVRNRKQKIKIVPIPTTTFNEVEEDTNSFCCSAEENNSNECQGNQCNMNPMASIMGMFSGGINVAPLDAMFNMAKPRQSVNENVTVQIEDDDIDDIQEELNSLISTTSEEEKK
jgi:hypothetical protein